MNRLQQIGSVSFLLFCGPAKAQSIVNGNFEDGTTGWTNCMLGSGPESTYGGSGSNTVAEVDGGLTTSPDDDRMLCQSIAGLTAGSVYAFSFDASRRASPPAPDTVSVVVRMGESGLNTAVSRSGGWNLQHGTLFFTASQTTEDLTIRPGFEGSYGMIFDNLAITLVSALPVELLSFDAQASGAVVDLKWVTATERDNHFFDVERSADNDHWKAIAEVDGSGSTQELHRYACTDNAPLPGQSYYRLKQVDLDGGSVLSDVRSIYLAPASGALQAWPNPAVDHVFLQGDHLQRLEVTNAVGMHVDIVQERSSDHIRLNIAALPQGMYYVNDLQRNTVKFIKQ